MKVEAFVAVAAKPIAEEEVALGHLAQVELVQELAGLALLAQAAQPVLADQRVERMTTAFLLRARGGDVAFGTACAHGTVAVAVGFTYGAVGGEAVEVRFLEEGREGEGR